MRSEFNISCGRGQGVLVALPSTSAGSSYYKMWAGLNGFDSRNNLVLSSVRIGMGCMNLVTVISRYTRVPVTLIHKGNRSSSLPKGRSVRKYMRFYTGMMSHHITVTFKVNSILRVGQGTRAVNQGLSQMLQDTTMQMCNSSEISSQENGHWA